MIIFEGCIKTVIIKIPNVNFSYQLRFSLMIPLEVPPTRLKILLNFALFFSNFLHIYLIIDIDPRIYRRR